MLASSNFIETRQDTYALCIYDPPTYYHFARHLLSEFVARASDLKEPNTESELNEILRGIRDAYLAKSRIITEPVLQILESVVDDSEASVAAFLSGEVVSHCHTKVVETTLLPIHKDVIRATRISGAREALEPTPDLMSTEVDQPSEFISSSYVSSLLAGTQADVQVLARGDNGADLIDFINSYTGDVPCELQVRTSSDTPSSRFVVTRESNVGDSLISMSNEIRAWVCFRDRVRLSTAVVGAAGPLFQYRLGTSLIDTSLVLRPGMSLKTDPSVRVARVVGERVELQSPTAIYGDQSFVYTCDALWSSYLRMFSDIEVKGSTEEERAQSLSAQVTTRVRACRALLVELPAPTTDFRFEIKKAHFAVGADNAYNLLERGRLIEYHRLSEAEAKQSHILSTAAAHIRAGTRL